MINFCRKRGISLFLLNREKIIQNLESLKIFFSPLASLKSLVKLAPFQLFSFKKFFPHFYLKITFFFAKILYRYFFSIEQIFKVPKSRKSKNFFTIPSRNHIIIHIQPVRTLKTRKKIFDIFLHSCKQKNKGKKGLEFLWGAILS